MSETLRATFRRVLRLENRRGPLRRGRLEQIDDFSSAILGNSRTVTVYLPPGYDEHAEHRYPVLYMQDGQNIFDPARAFVPGESWRLMDAADVAIGARTAAPMIIVGVDHAGPGRMAEYTPSPDPNHPEGGRAGEYARMLLEELRPLVDERFRTAGVNAVGGSSLGGLVSLHLAITHGDVFRRVAAMSPSVWWNGRAVLSEAEAWPTPPERFWLDVGGREGSEALRDVRALRDVLWRRGWEGESFHYYEDRRADHSERAWARRARPMLEFLFPPS
jgi:predicted alpha/beta superfamily hydrolase